MPRYLDRSTGVYVSVSEEQAEGLSAGNYTPADQVDKPKPKRAARRRKTAAKSEPEQRQLQVDEEE